ncbi:polyketide synthase dehydratase-domain-containing protein [Aspergillus crustosus]
MLHPRDTAWLSGHMIQSQIVLPVTAYAAMAIEAACIIAGNRPVRRLEVRDFRIKQAIVFGDENSPSFETVFHFDAHSTSQYDQALSTFACFAAIGGRLQLCASGALVAALGESSPSTLPARQQGLHSLSDVDPNSFYTHLKSIGLVYTGLFRGLVTIQRKKDVGTGHILNTDNFDPQSGLLVHPALLDTLLHGLVPAAGTTDDGQLDALQVPTCIESITINPYFFGADSWALPDKLPFDAHITRADESETAGDVALCDNLGNGILRFEGLETSPLVPLTAADDRLLFSQIAWGPLHPDARLLSSVGDETVGHSRDNFGPLVQQIAFRFPHMRILQIGGSVTTTKAILNCINHSFYSYTLTGLSTDALSAAQKELLNEVNKLVYQVLDISLDLQNQGFELNSYDLIIYAGAAAGKINLERTLTYTRSLLKPAGYLIAAEPSDLAGSDLALALARAGFSSLDTIARGAGALVGDQTVFVTQKVDDSLNALRRPLLSTPPPNPSNDLIIIGGVAEGTAVLASVLRSY